MHWTGSRVAYLHKLSPRYHFIGNHSVLNILLNYCNLLAIYCNLFAY